MFCIWCILIKSCKYLDSGIRFCKFATLHLMSIIGKKIYRSIGEQKNCVVLCFCHYLVIAIIYSHTYSVYIFPTQLTNNRPLTAHFHKEFYQYIYYIINFQNLYFDWKSGFVVFFMSETGEKSHNSTFQVNISVYNVTVQMRWKNEQDISPIFLKKL